MCVFLSLQCVCDSLGANQSPTGLYCVLLEPRHAHKGPGCSHPSCMRCPREEHGDPCVSGKPFASAMCCRSCLQGQVSLNTQHYGQKGWPLGENGFGGRSFWMQVSDVLSLSRHSPGMKIRVDPRSGTDCRGVRWPGSPAWQLFKPGNDVPLPCVLASFS